MPRKAIIGAVVTFFLFVALGIGVYLAQHPQILKSRASSTGQQLVADNPGAGSVSCTTSGCNLRWQAAPSARYYYVVVIENPDANGGGQKVVDQWTELNSLGVTNLVSGKPYLLKVRGYSNCDSPAACYSSGDYGPDESWANFTTDGTTPPPPTTTTTPSKPTISLFEVNNGTSNSQVCSTGISGIAQDADSPNTSIPVDIYVGSTQLGTVIADQSLGGSTHGFRWVPTEENKLLLKAGTTISLYAINVDSAGQRDEAGGHTLVNPLVALGVDCPTTATTPVNPPTGGASSGAAYCRVTATPTPGSRSISIVYGGTGPTNSIVRLWLKKADNSAFTIANGLCPSGAACTAAPNPVIREYTGNGSHEFEIFNIPVTNPTPSDLCNGSSCSTTLNVDVRDDGNYQAFCDVRPPTTVPQVAGCSGNPVCSYNGGQTNCISPTFPISCTSAGGATSQTSAFSVSGPAAPPPPPPADNPPVSQACSTEGIGSGTTDSTGACQYNLALTCAPSPSTINPGDATTWNITYGPNVTLAPQIIMANDANQGTPGAPIPGNGSVTVPIISKVYSTAGTITPTVTLSFPQVVPTAHSQTVTCTPLIVGTTTLKVVLALSSASIKPNQAMTITATASDTTSNVTSVQVYAAKASGPAITEAECGQALINGACLLGGKTGLSGEKTPSPASVSWTPKVAGNYIIYATATNSTQATCSGAPNATGVFSCGNDSHKDLSVGMTHAVQYRLAGDSVTFGRCPLSQYNTDGTSKLTNCPQLESYGPDPAKYVSAYSGDGTWNAPGAKTIFVEFIYSDGTTKQAQKTVDLVALDPVITSVSCSVDITGKGVNIAVRGSNFGTKGTTLTLNDSAAKITKLTDSTILANTGTPSADSGTSNYNVTVKRSDGQTIDNVCSIGSSLLSVGAKVFCRAPSNYDVAGVDVTIVEATPGAKPLKAKASIDKDGLVQGLNATLQDGKCYKMSIKTPKGVRKSFQFQAGSGTTVIPDLRLPIGDIFPVSGDGKINSLDRSELVRQWNASLSSTKGIVATNSATTVGSSAASTAANKTGDFNLDGLINSFDASCMMADFNADSAAEVTAGPITNDPTLAAQCDNPTPIEDN